MAWKNVRSSSNTNRASNWCSVLSSIELTVIGRTISHYRIVSHLGGGAMGVVYLAEDVRPRRRLALKFLPDHLAGDPDSLERFPHHTPTPSRINHPHNCTPHDIAAPAPE